MAVTPGAAGKPDDAERSDRFAAGSRGSAWFPLVLFGAVAVAASPLYALEPMGTADLFHLSDYRPDSLGDNPAAIAVFWLIASPLGYLLTFVFYRARARRRDTTFPTASYLLTGLALLALLAANFLAQRTPLAYFGDLYIRALTSLFVIAIGVFVLAYAQRSAALGMFAVGFLGLVVLANLYDLAGLIERIGLNADNRTNIVVVGAVLILAGAVFGVAGRTTVHRTR